MPGDPLKHRLDLWLRSERAMGLPAVPLVDMGYVDEAAASAVAGPPAPVPPSRAAQFFAAGPAAKQPTAAPPGPPAVTGARPNLYGNAEPPMAKPSANPLPLLDQPFAAPVLTRDEKIRALRDLDDTQVKGCTKCRLHQTRTNTVFGEGDPDVRIFFIGEGPGENEDLSGRPFVGRAGQLLDKMIAGMGFRRDQVFIANIVKCRPPQNRAPAADETDTCTPYLVRQLEVVRPEVIVTLGLPSTQYMLQTKQSMSKMRGEWQTWRGIKVMPTFHPAYVLRAPTPENKGKVWSDLKKVLEALGLPVPKRSGKQE